MNYQPDIASQKERLRRLCREASELLKGKNDLAAEFIGRCFPISGRLNSQPFLCIVPPIDVFSVSKDFKGYDFMTARVAIETDEALIDELTGWAEQSVDLGLIAPLPEASTS